MQARVSRKPHDRIEHLPQAGRVAHHPVAHVGVDVGDEVDVLVECLTHDRGNDQQHTIGAAFVGAGVAHFARPDFFEAIVPRWMPSPAAANQIEPWLSFSKFGVQR